MYLIILFLSCVGVIFFSHATWLAGSQDLSSPTKDWTCDPCSGSGIHLQCRSSQFDSWVGKIPWRRAWQPTPVFLPGESPQTEEPGGLQSMGVTKSWTWLSNWTELKCLSWQLTSSIKKDIHICVYTDCCFSSVTKSCPILCDPMDFSTPGFCVLH